MRHSTLFILLGLIALLGGGLALLNPLAASLAVTTLVGIFFLIGGAGQLWLAFSRQDMPSRGWTGFIGALALIGGISLIADPLGGLVTLTVLLGILLVLSGIGRLLMAMALKQTPFFWFLLIGGAASILIGGLIFGNIAEAATVLLGLLLGLQLILDGIALLALGIASRNID
jgi:membrane protein HdeD